MAIEDCDLEKAELLDGFYNHLVLVAEVLAGLFDVVVKLMVPTLYIEYRRHISHNTDHHT